MAGTGFHKKIKKHEPKPHENFSEFFRPMIGNQVIADFMRIHKDTFSRLHSKEMIRLGLAWKKGRNTCTTPYLLNVYLVIRQQKINNGEIKNFPLGLRRRNER